MDKKIEEILIDFLKENCLPQKTGIRLNHEDNLFNTGILDSAALLHFVGYIEKKFEFSIPDEDLIPDKFTSIKSIADYIRSRIEEPAIIS
jgi:acyl carrier protein